MTYFTVQTSEIVCCFNLTRVLLKTCLLIENLLSTSACTQGCFHHNHQTVVLWITQTILLCGYRDQYSSTDATWPFGVSTHSGGISASAWFVSSFACCLDFFSWKATDTERWTGTCSSEVILPGIFAVTFHELELLDHILMKYCQSKILICLQFLEKTWHLTVLANIYGAGTLGLPTFPNLSGQSRIRLLCPVSRTAQFGTG